VYICLSVFTWGPLSLYVYLFIYLGGRPGCRRRACRCGTRHRSTILCVGYGMLLHVYRYINSCIYLYLHLGVSIAICISICICIYLGADQDVVVALADAALVLALTWLALCIHICLYLYLPGGRPGCRRRACRCGTCPRRWRPVRPRRRPSPRRRRRSAGRS